MIASRMNRTRHRRPGREHGLPTAAVVRSSQATPARRRGQACAGVRRNNTIAFAAVLSTPAMPAGVDNTARSPLMPDT